MYIKSEVDECTTLVHEGRTTTKSEAGAYSAGRANVCYQDIKRLLNS